MKSDKELIKEPGVFSAQTLEGLELPVIDITHPAFRIEEPSTADMETLIRKMTEDAENFSRLPGILRRFFLWHISRKSFLMRDLLSTSTTYLSGMDTYLFKLGPNNLPTQYSKPFDRMIASSLPGLSARLRLQDMASMTAKAIAPLLSQRPDVPLQIIDIAGGPCADSLNLLCLLNRENSGLLEGRLIAICVPDLENAAPVFAGRSLEALKSPGAPLQGLNASLQYVPYDWREAKRLGDLLEGMKLDPDIVVIMAEGGLFDYGTDDEISSNLKILYTFTPEETVVTGTFTPKHSGTFSHIGSPQTIARTFEEFVELASRSGWKVVENRNRFINYVVRMEKIEKITSSNSSG